MIYQCEMSVMHNPVPVMDALLAWHFYFIFMFLSCTVHLAKWFFCIPCPDLHRVYVSLGPFRGLQVSLSQFFPCLSSPFPAFLPITLPFHLHCHSSSPVSLALSLSAKPGATIISASIQQRSNSATVWTLTVPVPSLDNGGWRRYWSFLSHSVLKLQLTIITTYTTCKIGWKDSQRQKQTDGQTVEMKT